MHDITFAKEIVDVIKDKSKKLNKNSNITKVNANLSVLSHVEPDKLKGIFYSLVKGTFMDTIELDIKTSPVKVKCKSCGNEFSITKPVTGCLKCESDDIKVDHPREFFIESIEVEEEGNSDGNIRDKKIS